MLALFSAELPWIEIVVNRAGIRLNIIIPFSNFNLSTTFSSCFLAVFALSLILTVEVISCLIWDFLKSLHSTGVT